MTLLDPKPAWEKPCGGGLSDKLVQEFGDVVEELHGARSHPTLEVVFFTGRRARIRMDRPLVTVSRKVLGESLLEKALRAGALLREEKVVSIHEQRGEHELVTPGGGIRASLVVGADGMTSVVRRRFLRPFAREDLWVTHGALLPVEVHLPIVIRFFSSFRGYAWIFPRTGHTSVGIMVPARGGMKKEPTVEFLRRFVLGEFTRAGLPGPEWGHTYARPLAGLRPKAFADSRVAGANWALIGDASGSVDPLTGEGVYYALKTAHLLAEALIGEDLAAYEPAWKAMAASSIGKVAKKRDTFYHPAILRILGILLDYSPSIRALVCDLSCGGQPYDTLRSRIRSETPAYIRETLSNLVLRLRGNPS